jgi:chaperone modulatory protein CbpM
MEIKRIIISEYCNHYNIETSFIDVLEEIGIFEFIRENDEVFLDPECLNDLERCRELHYELHINPEGIDVILNLLKKQNKMQAEIQSLKNRLKLHE